MAWPGCAGHKGRWLVQKGSMEALLISRRRCVSSEVFKATAKTKEELRVSQEREINAALLHNLRAPQVACKSLAHAVLACCGDRLP